MWVIIYLRTILQGRGSTQPLGKRLNLSEMKIHLRATLEAAPQASEATYVSEYLSKIAFRGLQARALRANNSEYCK